MNINIVVIFVLLYMLNCSCRPERNSDAFCLVIDSEFTGKECVKLSDFVESIEIVPLETNQECLVETIGKIIKYKDYYYIASASNVLNKILIFDENGKFVDELDKKGIGPDEYLDITDFDVIDYNTIVILSHSNPGIYVYDIDKDSCISHNSIGIYPNSILVKDNYFYVMNNGYLFQEETNDLIFKYDRNGNLIQSFFNVDSSILRVISSIKPLVSLSSFNDDLYFNYPFSNIIYSIQDTAIIPKYELDFGSKALSIEDLYNAGDIGEVEKYIKKNKGVDSFIYYAINSSFSLFTFYDYQLRGYILLYNSDKNNRLIAHEIIDDLYFKGNKIILKPWKLPKLLDDNIIYYHITPSDLIDYFQKFKKRLSESERKLFCSSHPTLISVMNNISEEDNPLLLKIKLKSI